MLNSFSVLFTALLFPALLLSGCSSESPKNQAIQLYILDGGTIEVSDMADFSRKGVLDGQSNILANPSFLIRHPKGDLLWDSGNSDAMAEFPEGMGTDVYLSKFETTITSQLSSIGLAPDDIEYFSLSHLHPDHSGNANLFVNSTFIVNKLELHYMFSDEAKKQFGTFYNELESSITVTFDDQHDVFADGSVVIMSMPGHTPGSSVLHLKLPNSGDILLTGDLYAHQQARELKTIPTFNLDEEATLESRRKFEALANSTNAKVVIQHSKIHFDALPTLPAFLD